MRDLLLCAKHLFVAAMPGPIASAIGAPHTLGILTTRVVATASEDRLNTPAKC